MVPAHGPLGRRARRRRTMMAHNELASGYVKWKCNFQCPVEVQKVCFNVYLAFKVEWREKQEREKKKKKRSCT